MIRTHRERTIDQKMIAVLGTPCAIPPRKSNTNSTYGGIQNDILTACSKMLSQHLLVSSEVK
jgi:hypothetical protein